MIEYVGIDELSEWLGGMWNAPVVEVDKSRDLTRVRYRMPYWKEVVLEDGSRVKVWVG